MPVPVVDLAPWFEGTTLGREAVHGQVDEALRSHGALQVVGHRVPARSGDAVWAAAAELFGLPAPVKQRYAVGPAGRGWLAPGASRAGLPGVTVPPKHNESYLAGSHRPIHRSTHDDFWFVANAWPAEVPALRQALVDYTMRIRLLADDLLRMAASGLHHERTHFTAHTGHTAYLVQVHGCRPSATVAASGPGSSPHTAPGTLTVFDAGPASMRVEVWSDQAGWEPVTPVPGGLVVVAGELLRHWSGRQWRAPEHRLATAPGAAEGIVVEYAHNADADAVVHPVDNPGACDEAVDALPVVAGHFIRARR